MGERSGIVDAIFMNGQAIDHGRLSLEERARLLDGTADATLIAKTREFLFDPGPEPVDFWQLIANDGVSVDPVLYGRPPFGNLDYWSRESEEHRRRAARMRDFNETGYATVTSDAPIAIVRDARDREVGRFPRLIDAVDFAACRRDLEVWCAGRGGMRPRRATVHMKSAGPVDWHAVYLESIAALEQHKEADEVGLAVVRFFIAKGAILDAAEEAKKAGASVARANMGAITCPCCGAQLRYSIAANNGHVWASCSTEACVEFVE